MAFTSGLFFVANNFVIKETGLGFGEINAVRSIIQTVLMICIILANGKNMRHDSQPQLKSSCLSNICNYKYQ